MSNKVFYRNYDLYETSAQGPGEGYSGAHGVLAHESIKQFLKHRQTRLNDHLESMGDLNGSRTKMQIRIGKLSKIAGRNFDLGSGLYENMDKYHSVREFLNKTPLGFGHPKKDVNFIDFPIDEEYNHYDQLIYPEESSYQPPQQVGSEKPDFFPGDFGSEDYSSYNASTPIGLETNYTPLNDGDGKGTDSLDFGNDLHDDLSTLSDQELRALIDKYLTPAESSLFGLPDGLDPADLDSEQTVQTEDPFTGISDIGTQPYGDKWNI
jgi:hypothetical protein